VLKRCYENNKAEVELIKQKIDNITTLKKLNAITHQIDQHFNKLAKG
jgi:hypothetical protein